MATYRVTMIECDNPACDTRHEHSKDEPAPGLHIQKGFWVWAGGGPIPPTYACQDDCLVAAINALIEEES